MILKYAFLNIKVFAKANNIIVNVVLLLKYNIQDKILT